VNGTKTKVAAPALLETIMARAGGRARQVGTRRAVDAPGPTSCSKNQPFRRRLTFALAGIRLVFGRERSFRTHGGLALAASAAVVPLAVGPAWLAAVALSAGMVMALELVNAAIEYLLDHLHPGYAREIGAAKDAAAGAVLVASLTSLLVAAAFVWARLSPR
jgi:diacylglycerol kinase (ATP)